MKPRMTTRKIQLLKAARHRIATRSFNFLCTALFYAGKGDRSIASRQLRAWITRALGDQPSYEHWLMAEHKIPERLLTESIHNCAGFRILQSTDRMLASRLAWIDWMVAELEQGRNLA